MRYTDNYKLKKPEKTDPFNILDFNENEDTTDKKIKEIETIAVETKGLAEATEDALQSLISIENTEVRVGKLKIITGYVDVIVNTDVVPGGEDMGPEDTDNTDTEIESDNPEEPEEPAPTVSGAQIEHYFYGDNTINFRFKKAPTIVTGIMENDSRGRSVGVNDITPTGATIKATSNASEMMKISYIAIGEGEDNEVL